LITQIFFILFCVTAIAETSQQELHGKQYIGWVSWMMCIIVNISGLFFVVIPNLMAIPTWGLSKIAIAFVPLITTGGIFLKYRDFLISQFIGYLTCVIIYWVYFVMGVTFLEGAGNKGGEYIYDFTSFVYQILKLVFKLP
jgi:hypothetical protein